MKIVILERDGVINQASSKPLVADEWKPLAGSLEAIAALNQSGYRVVVTLNESKTGIEETSKIQHKMQRALEQVGGQIDAMHFCSHGQDESCNCRFPENGLILDIARRYHADTSELTLIGYSRASMLASVASGIRTILLHTPTSNAAAQDVSGLSFTASFDNLANAVNALISLDQISNP